MPADTPNDPRPYLVEARLREDLVDDPAEPTLSRALLALRAEPAPDVSPSRLDRLLMAVHAAQDTAVVADPPPAIVAGGSWPMGLLRAARSQAAVVPLPFYAAGVLVLLLGVLAGHLWSDPRFSPLLCTAPPLAVLGVAYAFRALANGMDELERACPVDPLELAISRLVVVLGLDVLLSLALLPWNAGHPVAGGSGIALLLDWLAPLLLCSGVTLLASGRFGVLSGAVAGLLLWVAYVLLHILAVTGQVALGSGLVIGPAQLVVLWALSLTVGAGCFAVALRRIGGLAPTRITA